MARVLTNNTSVAFAIEASLGVLPGSPTWKLLEPESISSFGATITKVARDPISKLRQRRKGTTTDLDSSVELEHDLTKESYKDFIEGFLFAVAKDPTGGTAAQQPPIRSGASFDNLAAALDPAPIGTESGYTHDALANALTVSTLIFARGFTNSVNNGMKEVTSDSTTVVTEVTVSNFIDETPGDTDNATIEVAGVRGATGDITLTVAGAVGTLGSTVLDLTTLGLTVGQVIHVGGLLSANQFATAGAFYARITSIATNSVLLDKLDSGIVTDAGAGLQIDLLFGQFIRNVAIDDVDFLERSYQFELTLVDLQEPSGTGDEFEYAIGNLANTVAFNLPLAEKATVTFGFIGTDTENPVTTQKTGASTPIDPVETAAYNTTADIARLRIQETDETGVTTCFKSLVITINNQVTPEKCLGTLGAVFMNFGNFLVDIEAQLLLTDSAVITAIKNNRTMTMDWIVKNDDGAIATDIPSMTLGGGDKEFPRNESVLINTTVEAFLDPTFGYTMATSLIPAVPQT